MCVGGGGDLKGCLICHVTVKGLHLITSKVTLIDS